MPKTQFELKHVSSFSALTLRFTAQNHLHFARVWAEIRTTLMAKSFRASAHPIHIIYAAEYVEDNIDNEIVLPCDASWTEDIPLASAGSMTVRQIPEILAVSYAHAGNPNRINEERPDLMAWLGEHHYRLQGAMRLIYVRGFVIPGEDYLIDVQHAIVKDGSST